MTPNPIEQFQGEFRFLSNFYMVPVEFEGVMYPSVEHAFQAAKTESPAERVNVRSCMTCGQAKRMGRNVKLRANWDTIKISIMEDLVRKKFSNQPGLSDKLVATDPRPLMEGNTWGDKVWGCVQENGNWVGQNHLGLTLMKIRKELQTK